MGSLMEDVGPLTNAKTSSQTAPWTDVTECLVAEIWSRTLASRRLDRNTSILEMRTGMLQVYRFLEELEQASGMSLPITLVFQAPTIPQLANVLRSGHLPPFDPAIMMKTGNNSTPLFILPGLGGSVFQLFGLAREICFPGAVYVNQQAGLDGVQTPHQTMEDMVRFQIEIIRSKQTTGPYLLLGYSFGGTLVLEVARRLITDGGDVGFIGLIEPYLPERNWPAAASIRFLLCRLQDHRKSVRGVTFRELVSYAGSHISSLLMRVGRMLGRSGGSRSPYLVEGLPPAVEKLSSATHQAVCRYKIRKFDGAVSLFLSELGDPLACDPLQAWPRYLTNVHVIPVAGDHATMIGGRNIKSLAATISDHLVAVLAN